MKILLTGGTGFLGRALLASFLDKECDVILSCRQPTQMAGSTAGASLCEVCGTASEDLVGVFRRHHDIAAIVHAATDYGRTASLPTSVFSGNVEFPVRLLEQAMAASVGLFINIDTFFNTKNSDYEYLGEYALSKRQFQEWGELCGRRGKIRFVNLRLFHLYGPGDGPEKFVSAIIRDCMRDDTIDLTEGLQRRDFIFVEDAVSAVNCVLAEESGKPIGYVHYDVGTGNSCSIREFVEAIKRLSSSRSILNFGSLPSRSGEFADACADVRALRRIGWSPAIGLEEGLRATIASHRKPAGQGD